jgi:hypothetical protein
MRDKFSTLLLVLLVMAAPLSAQTVAARANAGQRAFAYRTLPACDRVDQKVRLTVNTGTAGALPPPATADPIWKVLPSTTVYTTLPVSAPSLWLPNTATERWIQPAATGTPSGFPLATYVYSTQFVTPVDPYLYGSIEINGGIAADDSWTVKLNGVTLSSCAPGSSPSTWCFHSLRPIGPNGWAAFNRASGFLNTLTIEVKNTVAGSSSGLFVKADVVGVCSKCTTPVPPPEPPCGGNPSTC